MAGSRNLSFAAGALITGMFIGMAVIAQFWTPFDPRLLSIAGNYRRRARTTGSAPINWAGMSCR
jgi:hypothetical protein